MFVVLKYQISIQDLINCVWTKALDSVTVGHWDLYLWPFFEEHSALDTNMATFIHTHPTLTPIHIHLKLPRTIKKLSQHLKVNNEKRSAPQSNNYTAIKTGRQKNY